MRTFTVAVVSAGLSEPSATRLLADRLARAAQRTAAAHTHQVEFVGIELRDLAKDITDHLLTGFANARLRQALDAMTSADAVIAVTPVFSGSYSGLFKSFFDVVDPQSLAGKPVLLGATGGSARHSLMLEHAMRPLFAYLRAIVVPTAVFAATADFGAADGRGSLPDRIDAAGAELVSLLAATTAVPADDPDTGGPRLPSAAPSLSTSAPSTIARRRLRDADPFDTLIPFEELLAR